MMKYTPTRTSYNARYTFSTKEKDSVTGYSYFGSRYYNSALSLWLSVDPLADKYPGMSAYTYCANNPVKLTDPDGRWIPGLDEDGNVTYKAEKGDSYDTFIRQFDCRDSKNKNQGSAIFKNAGLKSDGSPIKEGTTIKGEAVKKATGNEVLKGNWSNMTKTQKAAQLIFAVNHSKKFGDGSGSFDFKDYASGFETYSSEQFSNFTLPTKHGNIKVRNLSIWFSDNNTSAYNVPMVSQSGGDYVNKYDFRFPQSGSKRSMFMFSVDNQYDNAFQSLLKK